MSSRDQLHSYLTELENRLRLGVLLRGAAILASVALLTTVLLVLVTNALAFSPGSLAGARFALLVALLCALGFSIILPLYVLNRRRAALRAESAFPQFQQRLITFVDRDSQRYEPFIELLAADTLQLAREAAPARLAPNHKLFTSFAAGGACLGVLVWMILAGPGYLGYGARRLWAGSRRGAAAFYDIRVSPGNATVRRNATETITAQLVGFEGSEPRLLARYQSASKWEATAMLPQPGGSSFEFVFGGIPENVEYYVQAGRVQSRHYKIQTVDLPSIKRIKVTYHYPAWTGLKSRVDENSGDLSAIEGTRAALAVSTDRPMSRGVLVLNNGQEIALAGGENNVYQGVIPIDKDGSYHVAAIDRGQLVRLSDDFMIEPRSVNPPEVSIVRPGRDYQASPIEEVTTAVKASDDYGLKRVSLDYSVNGGPEHAVNILKRKGAKEAQGSNVLYLENFKVVPGDVVSVYAKAKDANAESRTDMYFIEVEPFERAYRQSQLAGGGMGGEQDEISQREKEIIAATWTQQGNKRASAKEAVGAGTFLSRVQSKLREQALRLAGRLQSRGLSDENQEFSAFQKDMSAAAEAMGPAAKRLSRQKWSEAIPSEEKALQQLLRAETTFRQIQVAFGSRGGGGGAGAGRDLANLLDLELNTKKNQYETGQTAESAQQRAQQTDKLFQKLDELARREQELAEQQRNGANQSFQQRWRQEMLHREAEKLQRQLEQLAANSQSGQLGQAGQQSQQESSASAAGLSSSQSTGADGGAIQRTIDQLRRANEDLRRAASDSAGAADDRRAASRLEQAKKLLGGIERQQVSPQLDSLAHEADRLAGEEHRQAARIHQMFGANGPGNLSGQSGFDPQDMAQSKLADERQLLADDLSRLEKAMQDAARDLRSTQPGASSTLHEALGGMDQAEIQTRLRRSADTIRLGVDPGSKTIEPQIAAGIDRLDQGIREAQQALKVQQQNPEEEALDHIARLRSEIAALTRTSGNPAGAGSQAAGQPRGGQQSQQASPSQASESGDVNGRFQSGGPGGPRAYQPGRGPGIGTYIQPPSTETASESSASAEEALQRAQRQLRGLRRELRSDPESLATVQELMRDVERLGPGSFSGNPALVEQLRAQALTTMDKLELQLRRGQESSGGARNGDSLQVPPGYQEPVADYFRRLSKNH